MTWAGSIRAQVVADQRAAARLKGALTDTPERPEREDDETRQKRVKKGREE